MAFLSMDDLTTDEVRVTSSSTGERVIVTWGATTVRLTVAEAVDLVDAVATVLGGLPQVDQLVGADKSSRDHSGSPRDTLARDEDRVRAEAEVRESL